MIFKNRRLIFVIFLMAASLLIFFTVMKKKIDEISEIKCITETETVIKCSDEDSKNNDWRGTMIPGEAK